MDEGGAGGGDPAGVELQDTYRGGAETNEEGAFYLIHSLLSLRVLAVNWFLNIQG